MKFPHYSNRYSEGDICMVQTKGAFGRRKPGGFCFLIVGPVKKSNQLYYMDLSDVVCYWRIKRFKEERIEQSNFKMLSNG